MRNDTPMPAGLIEAQEDLVIDAQFLLHDLMIERGVSRAELARRLGISKARLSQVFRPGANLTLRTVAALFFALGETAKLSRAKASSLQPKTATDTKWAEADFEKVGHVKALTQRDVASVFALLASRISFECAEPANDSHVPSANDFEVAA
ncbi:transcriptional regulator with XRE-family HTH domain [Bradyrhizobium sp. USDA 3397]